MLSNTVDASRMAPSPTGPTHQLLLAEFIHRSANDFAVACAEICSAKQSATLDAMRDRLETATERMFALASIQRLLQRPNEDSINLGSKLCELCHHHAQARFAEQGVFVRVRPADVSIDSARGWVVLMIVSELLTNSARHAFEAPGGMVDVVLSQTDGEIRCVVSDDGVGIRPTRTSPGAGSTIIAALARETGILCGPAESAVGTKMQLRLPAEPPNSPATN